MHGSIACRDRTFKIVVVGDSHVGKTSLLQRYLEDTFTLAHHPTVGADYVRMRVFIVLV